MKTNAPSPITEVDPRDHRAHLCTEIIFLYRKKMLYVKKKERLYTNNDFLYKINDFIHKRNDFICNE